LKKQTNQARSHKVLIEKKRKLHFVSFAYEVNGFITQLPRQLLEPLEPRDFFSYGSAFGSQLNTWFRLLKFV
jgi:hypothetical protein